MNKGPTRIPEDTLTVDVFSGVIPNGEYLLKIYCKDMELGKQFKELILNNQAIVEKLKQQELGLRVALSDPNLVKTDKDYGEVRRYYNNLNRFLTTTHHSERSRGKEK